MENKSLSRIDIEGKITRVTLGRGSIQEGADVTAYINALESKLDDALAETRGARDACDIMRKHVLDLESRLDSALAKLDTINELARHGRETSQFTHARAALDVIIKHSGRVVERQSTNVTAHVHNFKETPNHAFCVLQCDCGEFIARV